MPGRTFTGNEYRFGFNGQEQMDEITGEGNHNTALFWEYDTRIARRWNMDPKPNPSLSNYSAFAGNPILNVDVLGDTTYLYNLKGTYLGFVPDQLSSNEIIFTSETVASYALSFTGNGKNNEEAAEMLRSPSFNYARITDETTNDLSSKWKSVAESSGLLYIDPKTHIVKVWECPDCPSEQADNGSVKTDISSLKRHSTYVRSLGVILGAWHSHPFDYLSGLEPTDWGNQEDIVGPGNAVSDLYAGGVGIVTGSTQFTLYGLADQSKSEIAYPANENKKANGLSMFRGNRSNPSWKSFKNKSISPTK
ncbi:MAG: hypothetical protein KA444_02005 [Bacteroidia bacterium]|nr:hypothetical protein [Bacteroidia bacterium]